MPCGMQASRRCVCVFPCLWAQCSSASDTRMRSSNHQCWHRPFSLVQSGLPPSGTASSTCTTTTAALRTTVRPELSVCTWPSGSPLQRSVLAAACVHARSCKSRSMLPYPSRRARAAQGGLQPGIADAQSALPRSGGRPFSIPCAPQQGALRKVASRPTRLRRRAFAHTHMWAEHCPICNAFVWASSPLPRWAACAEQAG